MSDPLQTEVVFVASVAQLAGGAILRFAFPQRKRTARGLLFLHDGEPVAFKNFCPHWGLPLDENDEEIRAADGRSLECTVHGAQFDPATGVCTAGPCEGASLVPLPVERDGDTIRVRRRPDLAVGSPRPSVRSRESE